MRWPHPKVNDTRRSLKFAWLPTQVDDKDTDKSYTVWLEDYVLIERYNEYYDGEHPYDCWAVVKKELYTPQMAIK